MDRIPCTTPPPVVPPRTALSLPHDQLPNETWREIFQCLPMYPPPELYRYKNGPIHEYPVQRMSRTCKRMRAIALPFMYSDIYLTTPVSVLKTRSRLRFRPELVRHVRRLDIYVEAVMGVPRAGSQLNHILKIQKELAECIFDITSILTNGSLLTTVNFYGAIPKRLGDYMHAQCRPAFIRAKNISFERDLRTTVTFDRTLWVDARYVQNMLSHCCTVEQIRLSMVHTARFTKACALPHSLRTLYMSHVQQSPDTYAVWLSELHKLEVLHISEPCWAGADFTSLIAAFGMFGPNLKSLLMEEGYMSFSFLKHDYFTWAGATTEMVLRCTNLTELHLKGVCYRADIVRDIPRTLVSVVMDKMQFGAGADETISYDEFVDGLIKLPNLQELIVKHNYSVVDSNATKVLL
ncbi:hypothetical protein BD410DRAFT_789094, partial [Rickenella mellea]